MRPTRDTIKPVGHLSVEAVIAAAKAAMQLPLGDEGSRAPGAFRHLVRSGLDPTMPHDKEE